MNHVDFTITRLADESLRPSLFDQDALEHILQAAYDREAMTLDGPYTAVFEQVVIGLSVPRRLVIEGRWGDVASPQQNEGRFTLHGLGADAVNVDALWRGAVVGRTGGESSRVERVTAAWPDPAGIDEAIAADLGSLPASPTALEAERRSRFFQRIRAGLSQPDLADETLDEWLRSAGAHDVSDLMTRLRNQLLTGTLQVGFTDPASAPPAPRPLPVSAAILVRDHPLDLAGLLAESKLVRENLQQLGAERPRTVDAGRFAVIVVWIVPSSVFDDEDWPGGEDGTDAADKNRRRRATAGQWLAREGIGLVTTAPHPS